MIFLIHREATIRYIHIWSLFNIWLRRREENVHQQVYENRSTAAPAGKGKEGHIQAKEKRSTCRNRPKRSGAQVHQQAKEKRGTCAPTSQGKEKHMQKQAQEKRSTGTPAGKGEEGHMCTNKPRRREAHVQQQAKEKRGPCDILTIC
jgi:hypothetical protein